MNKVVSVLYFHLFTIIRSPKIALPVGFLIFLQMIHYMTAHSPPAQYFEYIFLAEIFTFVSAVWLGNSSSRWIDTTTEQLLILRVKSDKLYYIIHTIFLFILSIGISLISLTIPTIYSFTGLFEYFTVAYFSYSFLLFLGSSFAGMCLGSLLHPRILTKKNEAQFSSILACVIAVIRYPLSQNYPILSNVLWVFPNISAHQSIIINSSELTLPNVILLFLGSIIYGIAYSIIKIFLLCRKKF